VVGKGVAAAARIIDIIWEGIVQKQAQENWGLTYRHGSGVVYEGGSQVFVEGTEFGGVCGWRHTRKTMGRGRRMARWRR